MLTALRELAFRAAVLGGLAAASIAGAQTVSGVGAPEAIAPQTPAIKSPIVSAAKIVTFHLYAPDAKEVLVKTEGLDGVPDAPKAQVLQTMNGSAMEKGPDGVWTFSLGPLMPGAFRYTFLVDGVPTTDPENPSSSESLTHVSSMFLVPGNSLFEVSNVPHGSVSSVFYHSRTLKEERRMHVYTPPGYEQGERQLTLYCIYCMGEAIVTHPGRLSG